MCFSFFLFCCQRLVFNVSARCMHKLSSYWQRKKKFKTCNEYVFHFKIFFLAPFLRVAFFCHSGLQCSSTNLYVGFVLVHVRAVNAVFLPLLTRTTNSNGNARITRRVGGSVFIFFFCIHLLAGLPAKQLTYVNAYVHRTYDIRHRGNDIIFNIK